MIRITRALRDDLHNPVRQRDAGGSNRLCETGEFQMSMRIDQPGQQDSIAKIRAVGIRGASGRLTTAYFDDGLVPQPYPTVFNRRC